MNRFWLFIASVVLASCANHNVGMLTYPSDKARLKRGIDTMLKYIPPELAVYDLHKGEVIADVGMGFAWLEGIFAIKYDSLTIYTVDIKKKLLKQVKRVARNYAKVRGKKSTLTIIPVLGSDSSCNLKPHSVNKLIIRETFHEMPQKNRMLQDFKKVIKEGGTLFVVDSYAEKFSFTPKCKGTVHTVSEYEEIFARNGYTVISKHNITSNAGYPFPHLHAEQKTGMMCFVLK